MAKNAMRTISLRNIRAHKVRLFLTVLSVVLGTAFIAGSSMMTASLKSSMDSLLTTAFNDVDVVMMQNEKSPRGISMADVQAIRDRADTKSVDVSTQQSTVIMTGSDGKAIQTGAAPAQAFALGPNQDFATGAWLKEGKKPEARGEIAINEGALKKGNLKIGDKTTVVTPAGRHEMTISGTFDSKAVSDSMLGVAFTEPDFLANFTDGEHVQLLTIELEDGEDANAVKDELGTAYGNYSVQTGQALVEQTTKMISQGLSFINYVLWAFAGIALLVGTFIISNTFAMIVAQRNRELALLRAVGASRGQITRSVVFEAIVVGLVGSVLGILAGVGLTQGLMALIRTQGMPLPSAGLGLDTTSVVAPLVVGVLITVLSAWAPARRAGSVHPVQAMRAGDQSSNNSLVVRTVFGALALVVGVVAVLVGSLVSSIGGIGARSGVIGFGAFCIVIGLWLAGPAVAGPLVGGLGRVVGAPFGAVGKLAATNSQRNPRRTAATAFALTLGLMMVSSIGMLGATMEKSMSDMIDDSLSADFVLSSSGGSQLGVPKDVPEVVSKVEGVDAVTTMYTAPVVMNGQKMDDTFGPPAMKVLRGDLSKAVKVTMREGSIELPEDQPGVLIADSTATRFNLKVGDEVTLNSLAGGEAKAPVKGIYEQNSSLDRAVLSNKSATELADEQAISIFAIYVDSASGPSDDMRKRLEDAVAEHLVVSVKDKNEFIGQTTAIVSQMLTILYALLALSVIVAVLGIVNTLALSVIERRQEVGMLRAVGTQRGQIRTMIYIESAVIAFYGALLGAVVGLCIGWAFIHVLAGNGLDQVVVPWVQVGAMLLASLVVGVLAAVWPGHQAARTKPLEAITD
ncbi:ABC transporter permease [Corynebacterium epidermidicanis]|uniref:ABC superfamily ATP binding cassette transporter, permease protein n=1 Tax=Corynebacterium epidermidicanis TaxID=1050174 RepID=A0A0G3GSR6_9CORY|nr:FtsX-like permease family protein [Corynebacterium epidermidicanis]AKK04201.1 ABC superfamily ATP binding cassette transporter, permease protein [Corynebacterium epidermidicanis]